MLTQDPPGPHAAKSIAEVPINFRLPVRPEDVPQTLTKQAASRAAN